mgnify:CR=1 FL=1
MTAKYAADTTVSPDRSRAEIEKLLLRYGSDGFAYSSERDRAMIAFRCRGRMVRYIISLPDQKSKEFTETPSRRWVRSPEEAAKAWEQACRARWRTLALVVKAKLEAIEVGISTFDEEFLSWIVLPDNTTVGQHALSAMKSAYETGTLPPMLPPRADYKG